MVTPSASSTTGNITTIAGNGNPMFAGDGGTATSAALNQPAGIAVDSAGNLYIADAANAVVRKVTPGGVISTVAGTGGVAGYAGDGGPATAAQMLYPVGVALDSRSERENRRDLDDRRQRDQRLLGRRRPGDCGAVLQSHGRGRR
jgi:hypothetical protein